MPLQPDMAPMEWICKPLNLIFKWSGGSCIEVGRYEDFAERRVWDQSIGVYDHASGKITLESTYEAFKAKCKEWIRDNIPDITAELVQDLVNGGFWSSNIVLYPERQELFIRSKLDPEGCVLVACSIVADLVDEDDYDEDGNITEADAQRIADKLNASDETFSSVYG
ncbi:hypothetical protein ACIOHC_36255 [Streptomyces sp. NPDC088252]|uniref:hypothetical protein n=1 Tax=Streptomyces sp. NPDC088252 TaxID=3365845 RepID=UPI0037F50E94